MNIWYEDKGKKAGPVTELDIPDLMKKGKIKDKTLVWHKYLEDWTPFENAKKAILPDDSAVRR